MIQLAKILGCGIVYFLVVYLFVIRREARPIIPWAVCIISQVVCFVFFQDIMAYCKSVLPDPFGMVLPSATICFGNLALIITMFGPVLDRIKEKSEGPEQEETEFRVAPLPNAMKQNAEQIAGKQNDDDEDSLAFIQKMIAEGRKDEALKYLKMLAYYGKDEQSRAEAAKMIAELNTVRE